MEEIVKRIGSIPGIIEVFLSDREGRLLASSLREGGREGKVAKATSILARSIFGLEGIGEKVEEVEINFGKERALIKNLERGFLCLFHTPKINPVLLRLSTGLQIQDLRNQFQGEVSQKEVLEVGDAQWWMTLEKELKRAVGPIAGYILEEKRKNWPEPLTSEERERIVREISEEIPTAEKREEFIRGTLRGLE